MSADYRALAARLFDSLYELNERTSHRDIYQSWEIEDTQESVNRLIAEVEPML